MENTLTEVLILLTNFKFLAAIALIATTIYNMCRSNNNHYLLDFIAYRIPNDPRANPIPIFAERSEGNKTVEIDRKFNSSSMEEFEPVLISAVQNLLSKNKINPKSIDFLITNCSIVSSTDLGLRSDVTRFDLTGSGVGKSANAALLSVSLAKDLLKVHKNSRVLILGKKSISFGVHKGKVAALLLSNRETDKNRAKYEMQQVVNLVYHRL